MIINIFDYLMNDEPRIKIRVEDVKFWTNERKDSKYKISISFRDINTNAKQSSL